MASRVTPRPAVPFWGLSLCYDARKPRLSSINSSGADNIVRRPAPHFPFCPDIPQATQQLPLLRFCFIFFAIRLLSNRDWIGKMIGLSHQGTDCSESPFDFRRPSFPLVKGYSTIIVFLRGPSIVLHPATVVPTRRLK